MGSKSGSGSAVVGFRYFMSVHMGISRGPLDEIVQINVGDVRAWPVADGDADTVSGLSLVAHGPGGVGVALNEDGTSSVVSSASINTISASGVTQINAPNLFGGDAKEGGINGSLTVMMGESTQVVATWIKSLLGGRVPNFRGACTLFYDGLLCSLNPYPKSWKIRVRRTVSDWDGAVWQPSLAAIWMASGTIKAMNGAHIVYECLTNRDWGRGFSRDLINDAAFTAVAQTLYDEGFGLCLRWNRQDQLSAFIQEVINHIGGSLYVERSTGLLTLALLRGDYDPATLPSFTYDTGLISIEDDDTATQEDAVNEVIVNWNDPIKDEARQARIQNLASLQTLGATNSTTTDYAGIPTVDLALRVAQRDLRANATSLKRYKVILDRRAWRIIPGAVFKISAPDKNIFSVVLRAGKVSEGENTDGRITVEAILDVFGLPSASFVAAPPTEWTPPDRSAVIPSQRFVREATYGDMVRSLSPADLALVSATSGSIATMAGKPTNLSQNYSIATMVAGEDFVKRGASSFAPVAIASANISIYATSVPFSGGVDIGLIEIGSTIQIGDEICRLDGITTADGIAGTLTLARGCVDTLPAAHASGALIYFFSGDIGTDAREYAIGETVDIKMLTVTSSQELSVDLAPTDSVVVAARQGKPWAPGNLKVNGTPYATTLTATGDIVLSWAHRDRTVIQDQLLEHGGGSVGPETGVTYTVRAYAGGVTTTPTRTTTGIAAAGWTYANATIVADGLGTATIYFEIDAVRDGIVSMFKYRFPVTRS